jgi:hypothetical protein
MVQRPRQRQEDVHGRSESLSMTVLARASPQQTLPYIENGWPSVISEGVQPNSPDAVADIPNEHVCQSAFLDYIIALRLTIKFELGRVCLLIIIQGYYTLLDAHCAELKGYVHGGVGWFAHIYSDAQEPGYGIYNENGQMKFPFSPKTHC